MNRRAADHDVYLAAGNVAEATRKKAKPINNKAAAAERKALKSKAFGEGRRGPARALDTLRPTKDDPQWLIGKAPWWPDRTWSMNS